MTTIRPVVTPPHLAPRRRRDLYRYVPPEQPIAGAVTYVEDVLLEFAVSFSGSLTVVCPDPGPAGEQASPEGQRADLHAAGAALDRIADGLFVTSMRADRPHIESRGGHRFTHEGSSLVGPRTRRFTGRCTVDIATPHDGVAVTGSLTYALDITAAAPSDPPGHTAGPQWSARYDRTLATIGAVVLAPVPVVPTRAARLYCA